MKKIEKPIPVGEVKEGIFLIIKNQSGSPPVRGSESSSIHRRREDPDFFIIVSRPVKPKKTVLA